ncbi:MAG TPA: type II toxin-antitoxin system HicA family toxin [Elusimicrobiota bacterium]|nr:type II toxin-antitoxin system HicA family toxin [Elusimicrobiota bacterium]
MPGRLGSVKPKEFIRKLGKLGFRVDHQSGSHVILLKPGGPRIVVPFHAREMKRGLLAALLKQAGVSPDEFRQL